MQLIGSDRRRSGDFVVMMNDCCDTCVNSPELAQREVEFTPIPTPMLKHRKLPLEKETCVPVENLNLMNKPLTFSFVEKEEISKPNDIHNKGYSNNTIEKSSFINIGLKSKQDLKTSIPHLKNAFSLVNYDYSSDSDS
ncbi:hypothetical protein TNCT_108021 [Trichonephila clavata]|uniref:Uncharacterized protein n=1 Tax=Trichonephila clavata TaxID=2740835 RepID=A0A8X6LF91_TRICU|nr:hypothetical protein TNCT_108021 [Trichonephila clavata]